MKTPSPAFSRHLGAVAIMAALAFLPITLMQAQDEEKLVKNRGNISAIDVEGKALTLAKPNGDTKVVFWDDATTLESEIITQITDLKPGIYVRCIMVDKTDFIARIRHEPDKDTVSAADSVNSVE